MAKPYQLRQLMRLLERFAVCVRNEGYEASLERSVVSSTPMGNPARLTPSLLAALVRRGGPPFALEGVSGCGKTRLLRSVTASAAPDTVWCSARDLADEMVAATRADRLKSYRSGFVADPRPVCIEHLEDLRGKPRTRDELRHLLQLASARRPVLLSLTRSRNDADVLSWLRSWAEVHCLG